jgi:hypothetical protein
MQFVGRTIVSKVPTIVRRLRSAGLWTESRYIFGEVIQGVRTQRELSEMVDFVTTESAIGMLSDPSSGHDLAVLLRQLLNLNYPHAAIRVLTSGIGSDANKCVFGAGAAPRALAQPPNLAEIGFGMLAVGEPQGLTFCAASCYVNTTYEWTLDSCSLYQLIC